MDNNQNNLENNMDNRVETIENPDDMKTKEKQLSFGRYLMIVVTTVIIFTVLVEIIASLYGANLGKSVTYTIEDTTTTNVTEQTTQVEM